MQPRVLGLQRQVAVPWYLGGHAGGVAHHGGAKRHAVLHILRRRTRARVVALDAARTRAPCSAQRADCYHSCDSEGTPRFCVGCLAPPPPCRRHRAAAACRHSSHGVPRRRHAVAASAAAAANNTTAIAVVVDPRRWCPAGVAQLRWSVLGVALPNALPATLLQSDKEAKKK